MRNIWSFLFLTVVLGAASCASTIHTAARDGNTEAIQEFLKQGVDVNARNDYGSTPLMEAISGHRPATARALIEAGADVNATRYQFTPLIFAVIARDVDTIKLLLGKGADPKAFNNSAVRFAVIGAKDNPPKVGIARLLVEAGADVNASEPKTFPFLWSAIQFGTIDVVRELIDLGADIEYVFHGDPPFDGLDAVGWAKLWKNEAAEQAVLEARKNKNTAQ
jgi:uncharacterized protein